MVRAVKHWNGLPGQAKESPHLQAFKIVKFSSSEWLYVWSSLRQGEVGELQREGWPLQIPSQSLGFSLPDGHHLEEGVLCHSSTCPLSLSWPTLVMHEFTTAVEMIEIFRHNGGSLIGSSGKPRCLDQLKNNNHLPCRGLSIHNQLCFYS